MITWIDDEVATVIDASTVELANFGTVGLLQGSVEPVAVEATPAELLPTGTAVRFEIDLEVTRERHRASGLVFRKDDGRFVPGRA
jgi:hypothetical protein